MTGSPATTSGRGHDIGQAPGRLAAVQAFVNTLDLEQATDEIGSPSALDAWLQGSHLARPGGSTSGPSELALAVELREALRGVLRSHVTHGPPAGRMVAGEPSPAAQRAPAARLAEISSAMQARISADTDGSVRIVAADSGARAALAELLLIAAEAHTLGTWSRLKVCSADDCQWAFYDRSPTRSGCWCSMQICGSRAKSRAYRSRATAEGRATAADRAAAAGRAVAVGQPATASRSARTEAPGA